MADDTEVVLRARSGDEGAWREIFHRHGEVVRRVCSGFGSFSSADVEDAVQETFVKAFRSIAELREPRALRAWLCTIARSVSLRRLVRGAHRAQTADRFAADPTVAPAPLAWDAGVDAPSEAEREARIAAVRSVIDGLPEGPERDTVRLFYLEGQLSAREIADQLGVGKSTVTMRLERFRARIKKQLVVRLARLEGTS